MQEDRVMNVGESDLGEKPRKSMAPWIALLASLSPCYLSFLVLVIALVFSNAFDPPSGHSSALYSPNIVYLFALALPMFVLVPFGFILGVITVVKDRRRGAGPGHPLAWGAIVISGICLLMGCASTILPSLLMQFIP